MTDTVVYFMKSETGAVKIGRTNDIDRRFRSIITMSPVQLELSAFTPGSHEHETIIHHHFRDKRLHGEWFQVTDELNELIDYVKNTGGLPDYLCPHTKTKINRAKEVVTGIVEDKPFVSYEEAVMGMVDVENTKLRLRAERLKHFCYLQSEGWTYERIGKLYGMHKQQVHAIMNPQKVSHD